MRKVYWAQVEGLPSDAAIAALRQGVDLKDGRTAPAAVSVLIPRSPITPEPLKPTTEPPMAQAAGAGSAGASVTNWGGNGNWQAALACVNSAGVTASGAGYAESERTSRAMTRMAFPSTHAEAAAPVRVRDKKIDTVDTVHGKAFLAREYALKTNVTRTDTRTCPAGMVRKGKLAYTVQEFPANHKAPKWKDRSLVNVTMTPKGNNGGMVAMTLTRAKNPTVVQFQMRCAKG